MFYDALSWCLRSGFIPLQFPPNNVYISCRSPKKKTVEGWSSCNPRWYNFPVVIRISKYFTLKLLGWYVEGLWVTWFYAACMQIRKQEDHFFFGFILNNFHFVVVQLWASCLQLFSSLHWCKSKSLLSFCFKVKPPVLTFHCFSFPRLLACQALTHPQNQVQQIRRTSLRHLHRFFNFTLQFGLLLSRTLQVIPLSHWASLLQSLDFPYPMQLLPPLLFLVGIALLLS